MINDYIIQDFLGEGAFAKVKLVIKKQGDKEKKYAMKIFIKSKLKKKREFFKDANGGILFSILPF